MSVRRIFGAKEKRRAGAREGTFFAAFTLLLCTGLIVLYAASYYNAVNAGAAAYEELFGQMRGVLLGAGVMVLISRIDYHVLRKPVVMRVLVIASVVLLALVPIPGIGVMLNGSRRWLRLGPISFQPSELAKYAMIVCMAGALSLRRTNIHALFRGILPKLLVPMLLFFLILMQPNLSTAGSILIVAAIMLMLAGVKWRYLALMGAGGAVLGAYYALSEPYRRARLFSFRDPFAKLTDEGYQLAQSLIAFGSGGLFGMGLGRGRQKFAFLPYPESDFIFAVVGEDLGLIGCLAILGLFAVFLYEGYRIALACEDRFGCLLAAGIVSMIGVQTVMNVAVVTGLMPTTGLPLPFFSAGGTSIAIAMAATQVVVNIGKSANPATDMDGPSR